MLVLTRRNGEAVTITVPPSEEQQTIEVRCLIKQSNQHRLGFQAAEQIKISRNELLECEREEGKLWAVHIKGPDTVMPTTSKVDADFRVKALNKEFSKIAERSDSEYEPMLEAEVIEWIGTPEAHAERLAEGVDWSDLG